MPKFNDALVSASDLSIIIVALASYAAVLKRAINNETDDAVRVIRHNKLTELTALQVRLSNLELPL